MAAKTVKKQIAKIASNRSIGPSKYKNIKHLLQDLLYVYIIILLLEKVNNNIKKILIIYLHSHISCSPFLLLLFFPYFAEALPFECVLQHP